MTTSSDPQHSAQTITQDKAEVQKELAAGSTKHEEGAGSLVFATPPTTPEANYKQGDSTKFVLIGDDDIKSDSVENVIIKTKPKVQLQEKVQVQDQEAAATNSKETSTVEEDEKALPDSWVVVDNKSSHGQSASSQRRDNSDAVERVSPSRDGEPTTTDTVSELESVLKGLEIADTSADDSETILAKLQPKDDTANAIETAVLTQHQVQGRAGESAISDEVSILESVLKGLEITKTSVARPQSQARDGESATTDKVSELESALKGLDITKTSVARPQSQDRDRESATTDAVSELESVLKGLEITNTSVDDSAAIHAKKLPKDANVDESAKAVRTQPGSQAQIKAQDPAANTRLQEPASLSLSTNDVAVNLVRADSPAPRSQPTTLDFSSATNEQEFINKILQQSDVRYTQPKETARKDDFDDVKVVNKSPKTIYCNVIGWTTGRPCQWPASSCPHHQGQAAAQCNVIGWTTGRPCRWPASSCPHHQKRDPYQSKASGYCNVIGRTTGRPCRWPASSCPHH